MGTPQNIIEIYHQELDQDLNHNPTVNTHEKKILSFWQKKGKGTILKYVKAFRSSP